MTDDPERIKKIVFRGLLIGYPVFVLVGYFFLVHRPMVRLDHFTGKLKAAGRPVKIPEEERLRREKIKEQREEIKSILEEFAGHAKYVDRSTVSYRLNQFARNAGLEVESVAFSRSLEQGGWKLLTYGVTMRGTGEQIIRFLRSVETCKELTLVTGGVTIKKSPSMKGKETTKLDMDAEVVALADVPWDMSGRTVVKTEEESGKSDK